MLSPSPILIVSWSVLAALGLALIVRFALHYRHNEYRWIQAPFYILNLVYCRVVWRTRVVGRLPLDRVRGAVIICNHVSPIDPAFIQLASTRLAHWMVAREYSMHPVLKYIFRLFEAIPVSRAGVDTAATKAAMRYAQNGELVGLFPEGRINDTGQVLLPGRPGVALIALKAEVPVIPCYIQGAPYDGTTFGCFLMTAKVTVTIGEPIDISPYYGLEPEKHVLEELTKLLLVAMARLAGARDYEPKLAGRFYKPAPSGEVLAVQ
jgi:1-acyl-sn-glycerol-3-phosphate acyltransferase